MEVEEERQVRRLMRLYLIRHSLTAENLEHRYLGCRSDPGLCRAGITLIETVQGQLPRPDWLLSSPMRRCHETAALLFPGMEPTVVPGLQECDFGDFEGKHYRELSGNPAYQAWIDSGGTLPFPGGESRETFCTRCCVALEQALMAIPADATVAAVVHGGTIMAILSQLEQRHTPYFDCHLAPCGWVCCNVVSRHPLVLQKLERKAKQEGTICD